MNGTAGAKTARRFSWPESLLSSGAVLAYLALFKVLLHLLTAGNYGYFRDEFYYLAASERLDLGYVDFPPLVALLTAAVRATLGDSLVALHLFPALAGAAVVVLAGLMAREFGGGRFAQGLAALATLVAPSLLVFGTWMSMDAFDQLLWVAGVYLLVLILKRDQPKLWIVFGLVAGLGLLTKLTMLFFGFAVFVALLLTPARRHLARGWPWAGGALSFLFLVPYVYWQIRHGWPTFGFWWNYGDKIDQTLPFEFLVEQIATMHPFTLPVWLAGLYYFLFVEKGRMYRVLGLVYVILFVLFVMRDTRFYFLAPAYPALFAAGALQIERFVQRYQWNWAKPAILSVLAAGGAFLGAVAVVPVLPVEPLARITGVVGGDLGIEAETRDVADLPQNFADRLGWENMVATVAGVYGDLPPDERTKSCILAENYGQAGALDFFGPEYGLPRVISGHNSYYLWGTEGCTGEVLVSVGVSRELLQGVFGEVQRADTVTCKHCMPDENNLPVYVSRDPKMPLEEAWPRFKHYD